VTKQREGTIHNLFSPPPIDVSTLTHQELADLVALLLEELNFTVSADEEYFYLQDENEVEE